MPTPVKKQSTKNLKFYQIFEHLLINKKITSLSWNNEEFYFHIINDKLMLHKDDGKDYGLIITVSDMTLDDWYVLN